MVSILADSADKLKIVLFKCFEINKKAPEGAFMFKIQLIALESTGLHVVLQCEFDLELSLQPKQFSCFETC